MKNQNDLPEWMERELALGRWRVSQQEYEARRKAYRELWAISDAEDFCHRKGVEPGTYKPIASANL